MNTVPTTPSAPWLQEAAARGLLPEGATLPAQETRPWPVVLLIALGAWLAALPLLGIVVSLAVGTGAGSVLVGVLLLAAAVVLLRARELPVFVEQLALPALTVGGGALAHGLARHLHERGTAAVLCVVALAICVLVNRPWLRMLLGAAAAALFMVAVVPDLEVWRPAGHVVLWWALHLGLAAWIGIMVLQERVLATGPVARWAALAESAGSGWLLPVLAGLAAYAGMTMLVAGSLGPWSVLAGGGSGRAPLEATQAISFALAAAAVVLAGRRWPTLRQPAAALAGLVLAALAFFLPSLGATLLALALAATAQRWRLAGAAALAAAWIVGAFYYQLAWPLATKAVVLAAAGALLGGLAWFSARAPRAPAGKQRPGLGAALIAAGAVLTLVAANHAIWQKEDLIARGDKVYVRLAPVDPRSLMQGDFMRLNFGVPGAGRSALPPLAGAQRPVVVARREANGVAQLLRSGMADLPLAPGEMRIQLTPKGGQWILVSDAWFFREGEAARFERARYGEFRVLPDGRALLVGMADEQLRPL
jgi:uncharacterized membrane-anchored protein